jgi:DNA-binding transcriptional ArsR family regulator
MARTSSASDVFHAIADANRRALLDEVAAGETSVGDLVARVGLSYSAVSQHLAVLHQAGLVKRRERGRHRLYRLNSAPLRDVHTWVSRHERFWRTRLARLRRVLDEKG